MRAANSFARYFAPHFDRTAETPPSFYTGATFILNTYLVTGAAGFIGSHVAGCLLARGDRVVGIDNLNSSYDANRKRANLEEVRIALPDAPFHFAPCDIRDRAALSQLFASYDFTGIAHLAALAGVRASQDEPQLYFDVNVSGTLNLLDGAAGRLTQTRARPNFVFATTSSAYGNTQTVPFIETDPCNTPLAPYAASKRSAELLGHSYHHLHRVPFTALRFFNVYGPRGRPDMMAYKVLESIHRGTEIPLYNNGQMHRDWTYIDDIVSGVVVALDRPQEYEIVNLGRGHPVLLRDFVGLLENLAGCKANLVATPTPDADMLLSFADIAKARRLFDYDPQISVEEGTCRFYEWFQKAVAND